MNRLETLASYIRDHKFNEAERLCMTCLADQPTSVEYINYLAQIYYSQDNFPKATQILKEGLKTCQNLDEIAVLHNNLGILYQKLQNYELAVNHYLAAHKTLPQNLKIHLNLAKAYFEAANFEEAITHFQQTNVLSPKTPDILNDMGMAHHQRGEISLAIDYYSQAIHLGACPSAYFNRGCARLLSGDWFGWEDYQWRFKMSGIQRPTRPEFSCREWKGEPLAGKRLLVWHEQGFGDTLQFCRYLRPLSHLNGCIYFQCQAELESLFANQNFGIELLPSNKPLGEIPSDFHIPLMNLPSLLGKLNNDPYLRTDKKISDQYRASFFNTKKLKVGLYWQGNRFFIFDRWRSVSFRYFSSLAEIPQIQFYALQKGFGEEQIDSQYLSLQPLGPHVKDFRDTAAMIDNLDLVITSDSSVAHLAAAMGKYTWVLLSYVPDWRWGMEKETTDWYPNVRLFRQDVSREWNKVFQRISIALQEFISQYQAPL